MIQPRGLWPVVVAVLLRIIRSGSRNGGVLPFKTPAYYLLKHRLLDDRVVISAIAKQDRNQVHRCGDRPATSITGNEIK
ncbi:hypothetical protein F0562_029236 [Nyssa sinensis]|uniref:Secreted protein n=1 Tax=Nyssa sinensis TaxID=561372 RepID=A0A5J5B2B1_9ASTE|nr:hypothetical protein F0562_029236 [Nyssa sinensis]